ncbi:MAG: nitroreductase [Bacteroidales bacterium]|nr:MAG: nitroreductase [Bacteroidales bacterium]
MILETIQKRKSNFSYSEKPIEKEKMNEIFEAATLAASSMNVQPWRFIYANKTEPEFQLILNALAEGNQRWAKEAATLVISIAQTEYSHKEKMINNAYAWHDTGMANAHLMLQAANLGLVTHPMGGFDHQKIKENFSLPNELEPILIIALGYIGDESKLPEDLLKRQSSPRKRKPIKEVVFKGTIE